MAQLPGIPGGGPSTRLASCQRSWRYRRNGSAGALRLERHHHRGADAEEQVVQEAAVLVTDEEVGVEVRARRVVLERVVAHREVDRDEVIHEHVETAAQVDTRAEAAVERWVVVGVV